MEVGLAILVLAVLETALSLLWVPVYFRFGIPIFRARAESFNPGAPVPTSELLADATVNKLYPDLVFRPLDEAALAFRETARPYFGRFSYTPVMHGHIAFDRRQANVVVTGLANWFPIFFSLIMVGTLLSWGHEPIVVLPMLLFLAALIGGIYWLQMRRYRTVCRVAASLWSGHGQAT